MSVLGETLTANRLDHSSESKLTNYDRYDHFSGAPALLGKHLRAIGQSKSTPEVRPDVLEF